MQPDVAFQISNFLRFINLCDRIVMLIHSRNWYYGL